MILSDASNISPSLNDIPNCEGCGATRTFEMQLMPHLVSCLRDSSLYHQVNGGMEALTDMVTGDGIMVDFGCVYIYTCSASCWNDHDDVMRIEVASIQPDPENIYLT